MEKKENLDYILGPMIRNHAMQCGISITNLKCYLSAAMLNHEGDWRKEGVSYEEETINGYLYGKAWPDMTCNDCVTIVRDAFEMAIEKEKLNVKEKSKAEEDPKVKEVRKYQKAVKFQIECAYDRYRYKFRSEIFRQGTELAILSITFQHMKPVVAYSLAKNMDACFSLDANDIAFWKIIRKWDSEKKKKFRKELSEREVCLPCEELFRRMQDPILSQWLDIRDKDYSQTLKKSKNIKTQDDIANLAEKNAGIIKEGQFDSFNTLIFSIISDGDSQNGAFSKDELDLILMFKYCLSSEIQQKVLMRAETE